MPNVRPLNRTKYNITKHRFSELYNFCLQYKEWKDELKYKTDTVKSIEISKLPNGEGETGNPTQELALRRMELEKKCRLVEETAMAAGGVELYPYIMKAVTEEGITYRYLSMIMNISCSKNTYYERRKKFYWLMDKKKN